MVENECFKVRFGRKDETVLTTIFFKTKGITNMKKEVKETVLKSVEYVNERNEMNNRRVRICNSIGMLFIATYLITKECDIYATNNIIRCSIDLAQGFGIGMLLTGIVMSSRYGAKIRAFKKRIGEMV